MSTGRRNRVRPDGALVATSDRGLLWGNRGPLLAADGRLARHSSGRGWVICLLDFRGRLRTQWQPGRLTELYFLDEATALAAGHRPCGQCRHDEHRRFLDAWSRAHPSDTRGTPAVDARLHRDRLVSPSMHRTHRAALGDLPDGVMVERDSVPWLVLGTELLAWSTAGYLRRQQRASVEVTVLTPRSTVVTLRAGYAPALHPTARS